MSNPFNVPVEERDIASYRKEAMVMIIKFAGPSAAILRDEDAVTNVASAIAKAEHNFDPSRGFKRTTLRITYGKNQIWKELRQAAKRKEKTFSIDAPRGKTQYDGDGDSSGLELEDYRFDMSNEVEEEEERGKRRSMARKMIECHALTNLQKEYLYLKYVKDISVKEIAEKKKCSKQAVAQVIDLAIKKLRGMYFEDSVYQ